MMIRTVLLGLGVAAATFHGAVARDGMIFGAGTTSCSQWQQFRSSADKTSGAQAQAWLDGFLSGLNTLDAAPDFLKPKPEGSVFYAWVDTYCRENPRGTLVQAGLALKTELAARARRAN